MLAARQRERTLAAWPRVLLFQDLCDLANAQFSPRYPDDLTYLTWSDDVRLVCVEMRLISTS